MHYLRFPPTCPYVGLDYPSLDNAFNKGGGNQMQQKIDRYITYSVSTG